MSIYSDLIERFAPDGLSSQQQAEIDSIRLATQFDDNDSQWGVILPMYFLSNRREQARIDQEALLRAIEKVSTGGIDVERLGRMIGPHIDASDIEVPAPDIQPGKIAQAIARATAPAIESALAERVVKIDIQAAQEALRGAAVESLFSWQVGAGVLASLLIAVAAYWWGGHQMQAQYQPVIQQMQSQIQQAQAERDQRRR